MNVLSELVNSFFTEIRQNRDTEMGEIPNEDISQKTLPSLKTMQSYAAIFWLSYFFLYPLLKIYLNSPIIRAFNIRIQLLAPYS